MLGSPVEKNRLAERWNVAGSPKCWLGPGWAGCGWGKYWQLGRQPLAFCQLSPALCQLPALLQAAIPQPPWLKIGVCQPNCV